MFRVTRPGTRATVVEPAMVEAHRAVDTAAAQGVDMVEAHRAADMVAAKAMDTVVAHRAAEAVEDIAEAAVLATNRRRRRKQCFSQQIVIEEARPDG